MNDASGRNGTWREWYGGTCRKWWDNLQTDRAASAALRRAATLDAVLLEPASVDLHRRLNGNKGRSIEAFLTTGAIAGVLASVRRNVDRGFAEALGSTPDGTPVRDGGVPVFKPARAMRLRTATTPDEMLDQFRRAVDILDGEAKVADIALLLAAWGDERVKPGTTMTNAQYARVEFAHAYHGAALGHQSGDNR